MFLPSSVTVTALRTSVGADVTEADAVLQVSGASQQVVAEVTSAALATVVAGLEVQVGSGESVVDAVVTLLRSVATDGALTVEAVITPRVAMDGRADGSSVDVVVDVGAARDVITVPAQAIVSRLDGTYAVQVRAADGDVWVPVEVLEVRGSKVAVAGIDEGAQVLVPA